MLFIKPPFEIAIGAQLWKRQKSFDKKYLANAIFLGGKPKGP
jgi:hypothetical protein